MEGSLKNQAYYEIRQRILTCEYAPGAILNEAFLCEELSFSRTPVRDALSRLEHEHLLRIVSKKGIVIENITLSDIGNYSKCCCAGTDSGTGQRKECELPGPAYLPAVFF